MAGACRGQSYSTWIRPPARPVVIRKALLTTANSPAPPSNGLRCLPATFTRQTAGRSCSNRSWPASTRSGCRQTSSCRTGSPFCSRAPLGARRSRSGEPTPASASGGKLDDAARRRGQRRVHPGELELYPEVGFIVTICHIIRAGNAIMRARLSYCSFAADAVRLQLHALADNLANFMWTLALP
jgi:hypothetical protein